MFQTQPAKLLLKTLRHRPKANSTDTPVNTVQKAFYIYRAGRKGIKGSLDQLNVLLDIIQDYYFNEPEDVHGLYYSKTPSVLNILLHFTWDKLVVDDTSLICRYRNLDDWQEATMRLGEDIFTTSFLAAYDLFKCNKHRTCFSWDPYLGVETDDMNVLFKRDISELHAHLKGSSMNFELSWLSLMNYPCHREAEVLKLFRERNIQEDDLKERDLFELYQCLALAVALRLYLFERQINETTDRTEEWIEKICNCVVVSEIQPYLKDMSTYIWCLRSEYGRVYYNLGFHKKSPDYAINDKSDGINTILSGERSILYNAFRAAYDCDEKISLYLYAYIIFKQQFREKMIQMNDVVGFANFDIYEQRKSCFIPEGSVYEKLLTPMAFLTFLVPDKPKRYMEGRVTPKEMVENNSQSIRTMDRLVKSWLPNEKEDDGKRIEDRVFNGYYIFHFIKTPDCKPSELSPRHHHLRRKVKKQAISLYDYRRKGYKSASRVVGIDAANSEIKCRPEVFAQAFRFLRRHTIQENVENHLSALGMTYHVGEDFYDIVDGLRAVDEVLTFINFRSNDRLGHALVLGTDVARFYENRDKTIRATRQVLLDNFVWLYVRVANMAGHISLCEYLEYEAKHLYRQIFDGTECDIPFDINDYYDSWLLRGDAPETALKEIKPENSISDWDKAAMNDGEADVNRARRNVKAKSLYYEYHFNKRAKENGNKSVILPLAHNHYAEFIKMVDDVRELLLSKVERLHIGIECNPSSNLRIGEMASYIEHPILKFNNFGLNTPYKLHDISVSINTDDSGVFSTSLEREYELMGIALEKTDDERFQNSPRAVREWLNRVRKMSVEQRFKKEM